MNSLTREELAAGLAKRFLLSNETGRQIVDAVFEQIEADLLEGRKVVIVGFGTFAPDLKPGRAIDWPREMTLPDRYRIRFVPSRSLKDKCRKVKAKVQSKFGKDFLKELRRTD